MTEVIQGSDEWFALRAGKLTASRFKDLMSKGRGSAPSAGRTNLVWDCAIERMTGRKMDSFTTAAMIRGQDLEPEARQAYEDQNFVTVEEVGFVLHPEHDFVSCSPDGYLGDIGLIEIKCPNAANHGKGLLNGQHAVDYKWQVQGQMWVCERAWCDMVSYHPEFPENLRLAIVRVERDEEMIEQLQEQCLQADLEINAIIEQLKEKMK
jgi:putative phage-type endonuclease